MRPDAAYQTYFTHQRNLSPAVLRAVFVSGKSRRLTEASAYENGAFRQLILNFGNIVP